MGQKFAAFDTQGNITAFYDDADSPVPAGVTNILAISDDQWQACLASPGITIKNGALVPPAGPTAAQQLATAQAAQIAKMYGAYAGAIAAGVNFTTAAGVSKAFQSDPDSILDVQAMLAAYPSAVPSGFYWVSTDNTQVPFTRADLQGLAKAMGDLGWSSFQNLQNRKASINAATTVAAVQAVVW